MKKVSGFMKKNGPKPAQIHKSTLVNDCPATVLDVRRLIKIDLSNTSIFDDEQDLPPTQAIMTNIFPSNTFQICGDHPVRGRSLLLGGLVLVSGTDVRYTKEGMYFMSI